MIVSISSSSMAPMLAAMATCHLPRPIVARGGVLCHHVYTPSLSLCWGSDLASVRDCGLFLMVDARGCGEGGRICSDRGWRTGRRGCVAAVGGDYSLEPPDVGVHEQEVSVRLNYFSMRHVNRLLRGCRSVVQIKRFES